MTTNDPSTAVRGERERILVIWSGVFVAFAGLALYQLDNNLLMDFASSAMVFSGTLMAFPLLVVQALERSRTL